MRRALTILAAIQDSADNIIDVRNELDWIAIWNDRWSYSFTNDHLAKTRKSQVFRAERNIGMRWIKG